MEASVVIYDAYVSSTERGVSTSQIAESTRKHVR
jgi:hypothetical protein